MPSILSRLAPANFNVVLTMTDWSRSYCKIGHIAGCRASDIRTDYRKNLNTMRCAHHLATACRDTACQEKPVERDALIEQRIALVDADYSRWQTLHILAGCKAG